MAALCVKVQKKKTVYKLQLENIVLMFCFRLVLALKIGFNSISELFDILKFRNLTELFGLMKEISHLKNASTMQQNPLLYMYF